MAQMMRNDVLELRGRVPAGEVFEEEGAEVGAEEGSCGDEGVEETFGCFVGEGDGELGFDLFDGEDGEVGEGEAEVEGAQGGGEDVEEDAGEGFVGYGVLGDGEGRRLRGKGEHG